MLAIISENKVHSGHRYGKNQFRYAMTYTLLTFFVLLFLNYYCSRTSQYLLFKSKAASMVEKCALVATEMESLEVINASSVSASISQLGSLHVDRLVVTDPAGAALYDSNWESGTSAAYLLFPEIITALQGNDVFTSNYHNGSVRSHAAIPIVSYGTLSGCVYMMECDAAQGALIGSLQKNILWITIVLEFVVLIFSLIYATTFSRRLQRIVASIRIIREGGYSHKVIMGGNDELNELGDEFNMLTDRLQTSENKRSQFVSDASHELKTPLASIKLLSDSILQNDMDMQTVREFVSDIGNEADRLNRMSQKLLSLSRTEGETDLDCEIICLRPTVERAVKMLKGIAAESNIQVSLNVIQDSPILILEDDLYQIVFNLIENGIKYNTPGGSLTITLSRNEENAILEVKDTGVGIPEDAISHLFERFYRVDKARSRKTGGSGLGLSIVRSLVERHRGEISVASIYGQGSIFSVQFPIFDLDED